MTRQGVIAALFVLLLAACEQEPPTFRQAFFALGTLVEVTVNAPPQDMAEVLRETEAVLIAEEHRWRAWDDGELAALNRQLAAGAAISPATEIAAGFRRATALSQQSGGRFNPAIGRVVELWGFHREERPAAAPPSAQRLAALLPAPALSELVENPDGSWHSKDHRLWVDMGAFAKGLAVEAAANVLMENGIKDAIINAGGDLKVLGRRDGTGWRIGIRHPRSSSVLAALEARDGDSVFTSGDYERQFSWEGEQFHHILDPATGYPARGTASVTVVHADAARADAAATALFVAGSKWPDVAAAMGIDMAMVVFADGQVQLTPLMKQRVHFEQPPRGIEVRSP